MLCEEDLMCKTRTRLCMEDFKETKTVIVSNELKSKVFQYCFDQGFAVKREGQWTDF